MATMPHNDVAAFHDLLRRISAESTTAAGTTRPARILALCGAGLSAASGVATFRGSTAALWHRHDPMKLATPEAFAADPARVWRFCAFRRHMALAAQPNAGHYALAALATKLGETSFLCLTLNVDGLSPRAHHPPASLRQLHGSLFGMRCVNVDRSRSGGGRERLCDYVLQDDFADPVCPALATAAADIDAVASESASMNEQALPHIPVSDLPACPKCHSLLRPGVVSLGEAPDPSLMKGIDRWVAADKIDLMLVIGTPAEVSTAAGYIEKAREAGAVVATIHLDAETPEALRRLGPGDFAFGASAADLLPVLLEPVIGKLETA